MVNAVSIARYSAGNEKQYRKGKRIKHTEGRWKANERAPRCATARSTKPPPRRGCLNRSSAGTVGSGRRSLSASAVRSSSSSTGL